MGNDVKTANVEEIAAQHAERKAVPHLDDAPPPPEYRQAASKDATPALSSTAAGVAVDSKGIPFNDAVHARKKDGSPAKTKGGVWRKKTQTTLLEDSKPVPAATVIDPRQGAHTAAVQTCSMMEIAFVGLMGKAAAFDAEERETYVKTWEEFYLAYGIVSIPPWISLIAVTAMLTFVRLQNPECRAHIDKLMAKMKELKRKKLEAKGGQRAHYDVGNDRMRQNDVSPTISPDIVATQ